MGMAGKNITENRKEGAKEMQKTEEFLWTKADGYTVPFCKCRTDKDTRRHFVEELSHILSKCKQECLIDVDNMKIRLSVVPDAKTQSR